MKFIATMFLFILAILPVSEGWAQSQDAALAPLNNADGTIQELNFGDNTMIFEGLRYRMAPDLQVEIRGSYGAFTMLEEGMKAVVTFRVLSDTQREVTRIEQLPDNFELEGA